MTHILSKFVRGCAVSISTKILNLGIFFALHISLSLTEEKKIFSFEVKLFYNHHIVDNYCLNV